MLRSQEMRITRIDLLEKRELLRKELQERRRFPVTKLMNIKRRILNLKDIRRERSLLSSKRKVMWNQVVCQLRSLNPVEVIENKDPIAAVVEDQLAIRAKDNNTRVKKDLKLTSMIITPSQPCEELDWFLNE
jgi:hypothetical protein